MHVGIPVLTLLPGRLGGSETLLRGLVRGLSEVPQPRDRYTVLSDTAGAASLNPLASGQVTVRPVPFKRRGDSGLSRLESMLRARYLGRGLARSLVEAAGSEFDVLHYALTVAVPRFEGPRVVTVFDLQHELMPEFFSMPERAYRRVFYSGAIRDADVVMTISEFSRGTIVERHGVDPERVMVAYQDVGRGDLFHPGPDLEDAARLAPLALPERFVYYPANLWPHKNHARLLEALARSRDHEVSLVLSGQDYGRLGELRAHAERLGIADRIAHVGYVERVQLAALYRRAVGVIFPSLFEGLGIPPLEALACGCVVAASDAGSLPEVLGDRALWCDPRDVESIAAAIDGLVEGRAPAGVPPEDFWSRFTWQAAAEAHRRAYRLAADVAAAGRG